MSQFREAINTLINDLDDIKQTLPDMQYKKIVDQVAKVNSSYTNVDEMSEDQKNLLLVAINPDLLKTIKNPSYAVVKEAVKRNPLLLKNIDEYSPDIVMTAFNKDKTILKYVKQFLPTTIQKLKEAGTLVCFEFDKEDELWRFFTKPVDSEEWNEIICEY